MLLTLSTTYRPATDLGFLLMKHPDNVHAVDLPFGRATLVYPEAREERCTAALIVEVDPVELVRGRGGAPGIEDQYVNDRPYAASSLMAVAMGRSLGTAMAGRSASRQTLADAALPFEATVTPLPARGGGADLLRRLFEPLGYAVEAEAIVLDPAHPDWGDSPYVTLRLAAKVRLASLLAHLFVLIPVLDDAKHYYIGDDEVEKLLRRGEGWLDLHPERDLIVRRYLRNIRPLMRSATDGLDERIAPQETGDAQAEAASEEAIAARAGLHDQRLDRVAAVLRELGAASVLDLGCGEGRLLRRLLSGAAPARMVGMDIAPRVLATAAERIGLERLPDRQRARLTLLQGSLLYRDDRLKGFDAAALVEVIEHLEPDRLPALEAALFGHARPGAVVITTPNVEYNALFAGLAGGGRRHPDHRFEWTRAEFRAWAERVADAHGYAVRFEGIGPEDATHGHPTQMGVFTR